MMQLFCQGERLINPWSRITPVRVRKINKAFLTQQSKINGTIATIFITEVITTLLQQGTA